MRVRRFSLLGLLAVGLALPLLAREEASRVHPLERPCASAPAASAPVLGVGRRAAAARRRDVARTPASRGAVSEDQEGGGGIIAGTVVSARGVPVARALVDVDGRGLERTEEWGAFSIHVPGPGTYTVRARLAGYFDGVATQVVTTDAEGIAIDARLVFPAEGTLHGRAVLPDGKPAAGVLIKISIVNNRLGPDEFPEASWGALSARRSWLARRTDENGVFGFAGLDPACAYWLWWMDDKGHLVHYPEEVRGGRHDLSLVVRRHRLWVDARSPDKEYALSPWITVLDGKGQPPNAFRTGAPLNHGSEWDERTWVAPAGTRLRVIVFEPGYDLVDTTLTVRPSWGAQRLDLPMNPRGQQARLRMQVRGPQGEPVPHQRFTYAYVDARGRHLADLYGVEQDVDETWVASLPPCRVRVASDGIAGTDDWSERCLLYLPAETFVQVPERGDLEIRLTAELGGSLALQLHEPRERGHYHGEYFLETELRDPRGKLVPVQWSDANRTPLDDLAALTSRMRPRSLALPAGRYTLTVRSSVTSQGLGATTVPVEVHAGRVITVPVELVLEARGR